MQAKHKNTGRWEGVKPRRLSHFQVYLTAKKCGPAGGAAAASSEASSHFFGPFEERGDAATLLKLRASSFCQERKAALDST
jgi:hypothetical protein